MMQAQKSTSDKLWTRHFFIIITVSLLSGTSNNMLMTAIPLFAKHLGGSNSIAGLMMGVFMISAILFRPVFGNLLDSKGRRIVLITGAAICSLISFSYIFAYTVAILLALRFLNGIGFSANTNAFGTIVSDIVPRARLAEGIGYFGIANTLATAIGPALGLFLIRHFDYSILFMSASFLGILGLISSLLINYEHKGNMYNAVPPDNGKSLQKHAAAKSSIKDMLYEKTALPTALVVVFMAFTIGGIMTFVPSYAAVRGIENIGIYFTVYALALLLTRLFAGKLADRYGFSTVILPAMIIMILSFVILAFATSLPAFLISGILYGFGFGTAQPTLNAIIIKQCPVERRGIGSSTFFLAMDVGSGSGAVILGIISQMLGFTYVYLTSAACVIISLIAYMRVLHTQLAAPKIDFACDE